LLFLYHNYINISENILTKKSLKSVLYLCFESAVQQSFYRGRAQVVQWVR